MSRTQSFFLLLGLPWFLLQLTMASLPSLLGLVFSQVPSLALTTLLLLFSLSQVGASFYHILYPPTVYKEAQKLVFLRVVTNNPNYPSPLPQELLHSLSTHSTLPYSISHTPSLILEHQQLLAAQPLHRDVLVNLALLSAWNNQVDAALSYWETARTLDPNHPLFQE